LCCGRCDNIVWDVRSSKNPKVVSNGKSRSEKRGWMWLEVKDPFVGM